jgi:hypothetical protein
MSSTQNDSRYKLSQLGLIFTLVGWFWGGAFLLEQSSMASKSAVWLTTMGTVTTSEVLETFDSESGSRAHPVVGYQYVVNETTYTSKNLSFRPLNFILSSIGDAEYIIDQYPIGQTISVHYDPAAPMNAVVIEEGLSWADFVLLILIFGVGPAVLTMARVRRGSD